MAGTPDNTYSAPDEPGFLSVAGCTLKRAGQFALFGAIVGGLGALIAQAIPGTDVVQFFRNSLSMSVGESGYLGSFMTGAVAGGALGVITGVPVGCCEGVSKMQHYYNDVALPREHEIGKSQGVALGATLEHEADLHEQQGRQYRDAIAQRSGNYAEQAALDKKAIDLGIIAGSV